MQRSTRTLDQLAAELAAGTVTSRALVEDSLARIADPSGEGARVFLKADPDKALAAADFHDTLRRLNAAVSPFAGIPISVKDIFDIAGDVTTCGSIVLQDAPPAPSDAVAVGRLRAAGFVLVGRTNMTEFAFSGLGLNPHYGTPRNPWDRAAARIPGGSSSGAAVSVTDAMAHAALGTDTGGSCRIPAALCGIVGFKPTASRVPRTGAFPLSTTLDSVGPLARSVACCATLDAILANEPQRELTQVSLEGMRFGVPRAYVMDGVSTEVSGAFERALKLLAAAGVRIREIPLAELNELPHINRKAGFSAPEAYAEQRERIASHHSKYDPRVVVRILRGREQDAADYIQLHRDRLDFIRRVEPTVTSFDALLMPTVPVVAPRLDELVADEDYTRMNALILRNPSVVNFLDGCAVSIPCHESGQAPVGLTLFSARNSDRRLLAIGAAAEACLGRDLPRQK